METIIAANRKIKQGETVLTCILTDDERRARGIEVGACLERLDEIEDEFKLKKGEFERHKKELAGKIKTLGRAARTGEEMRTVHFQEIRDYDQGKVFRVRLDTGEIFYDRTMDDDDKQLGLFKVEPVERPAPALTDDQIEEERKRNFDNRLEVVKDRDWFKFKVEGDPHKRDIGSISTPELQDLAQGKEYAKGVIVTDDAVNAASLMLEFKAASSYDTWKDGCSFCQSPTHVRIICPEYHKPQDEIERRAVADGDTIEEVVDPRDNTTHRAISVVKGSTTLRPIDERPGPGRPKGKRIKPVLNPPME